MRMLKTSMEKGHSEGEDVAATSVVEEKAVDAVSVAAGLIVATLSSREETVKTLPLTTRIIPTLMMLTRPSQEETSVTGHTEEEAAVVMEMKASEGSVVSEVVAGSVAAAATTRRLANFVKMSSTLMRSSL